jgi:hypothetical protein
MTKDEILSMAKEAGIYHAHDSEGHWDGLTDVQLIERHSPHPNDIVYGKKRTFEILERFAALVAEKEREECAKECDARVFARDGGGDLYKREATASQCALAIRARSQK